MHSNIEKLEQAVKLLEELADDVVFVGGCATGILITDPAAPTVRGTIDVDVIANVDKLSERIGGRATLDCSLTTYCSVKTDNKTP